LGAVPVTRCSVTESGSGFGSVPEGQPAGDSGNGAAGGRGLGGVPDHALESRFELNRALPSEGMVHDRLNNRAFEWPPIPVPGSDSGDQLLVDQLNDVCDSSI
jgi:hypothetical protein